MNKSLAIVAAMIIWYMIGIHSGELIANSMMRDKLISEGWMRVEVNNGEKVICKVEGRSDLPGISFYPNGVGK